MWTSRGRRLSRAFFLSSTVNKTYSVQTTVASIMRKYNIPILNGEKKNLTGQKHHQDSQETMRLSKIPPVELTSWKCNGAPSGIPMPQPPPPASKKEKKVPPRPFPPSASLCKSVAAILQPGLGEGGEVDGGGSKEMEIISGLGEEAATLGEGRDKESQKRKRIFSLLLSRRKGFFWRVDAETSSKHLP